MIIKIGISMADFLLVETGDTTVQRGSNRDNRKEFGSKVKNVYFGWLKTKGVFSSVQGTSLSEPSLESSESFRPPSDWPTKGQIEFKNVTLKYFLNEAPALNNLSFTIKDGDKIGIVGKLKKFFLNAIEINFNQFE